MRPHPDLTFQPAPGRIRLAAHESTGAGDRVARTFVVGLRLEQPGPRPEFGVLGPDMGAFFDDHEFAEWMPGAWPIALDGAGGFYCLDLRDAIAARLGAEDAPVVWSHGGNLGWGPGEAVAVSDSVG